ncbi:hypothetical protein [Mumia zhuanghuii]|uniref:hypothetical protein n=1 Tax=Mumia zhuanghuii TaxID=2585211 RepID=UPI00129C60B6|nr:hypothetical protein [Mumia zhuanghuii]
MEPSGFVDVHHDKLLEPYGFWFAWFWPMCWLRLREVVDMQFWLVGKEDVEELVALR